MSTNFTKFSEFAHLVHTGQCPVCGALKNPRPIIRLPFFSVYSCACGTKYLDPSLTEDGQIAIYRDSGCLKTINSALAQYYEYETLSPKNRTFRDYQAALRVVAENTAGRELCEIGCGTGGFLSYASANGWKVFGIDSSPENVIATQQRGIEAVQANIFLYKPRHFFDVVVLWDVIEHPQNPGKLIAKCRELLKPDGFILIAVPYDPNIISVLARCIYVLSLGKVKGPASRWYVLEHTSYFSAKGLRGLLSSNHFSVVNYWKTETDLSRYQFSKSSLLVLNFLFFIARMFGLQNRLILLARKD